eukprot:TRINITY_DN1053_c0_g1_i1.p1 TRINITY_DN1053_c0_g1~~TRINITY_DN1053_c0_g1_i1.p1  ORF type:complete len:220 (+),score=42.11 TRINITY_DN1053_c0_g1_i1:252-911(+)
MAAAMFPAAHCCAYQSIYEADMGVLHRSRSLRHSAIPSTIVPRRNIEANSSRHLKKRTIIVKATVSDDDRNDDDNKEKNQPPSDENSSNNEMDKFRENLERIVGDDDSSFSGLELANLIRNKYGRSYDVTLIKKEFMGRSLLALNVMWKYREQRSFPLTEEEYLLRLDDVANNLKCWGAVSHVRNSLARLKEWPRIGKAVSIFIDVDETGGRASEWIYR